MVFEMCYSVNNNFAEMKFPTQLVSGKLIRRYKRFLADIELEDGSVVIAHCTNSGSMKSCIEEGAPVYLSPANDPKRKTKYSWEMIFINNGWVGVNTIIPNKLAFDAIVNNEIGKLAGYSIVQREVKFEDSRFDIYCEKENEKCFVEVKNVSMKVGDAVLFPDAVTIRGKKHLETLIKVKKQGIRAVMLYIIQRMDVNTFGPASEIDPEYAKSLTKAIENGVEVIAIQAIVSPEKIELGKELPIKF